MNEKISDDRLMEIKARGNQFVDKSRGSYGIPAIEMEQIIDELLSARQVIADRDKLIERFVENSKALAGNTQSLMNNLPDSELDIAREVWGNTNVAVVQHWKDECKKSIEVHTALLAELEGNKFETAMKRVLDENKGAWKALGGEEGKG